MKHVFGTAALATLILGGAAMAASVDEIVAGLEADGYTKIEVEQKGDLTEIEALLDGQEREIVVVTATGEVTSDKVEAEDDDGGDDGDHDESSDGDDDDKD